jgi:hypothetical protein
MMNGMNVRIDQRITSLHQRMDYMGFSFDNLDRLVGGLS